MKFKDPVGWAAAIGAGILVSVALLPQARGELVYEEQAPQAGAAAQPQTVDPRTDDRQSLRQVISASQKAQTTLAVSQPAPVAVAPAPVALAPAPVALAPAPVALAPAPVALAPAPVALAPAPVALAPAPVYVQAPVAAQPVVVAPAPAPAVVTAQTAVATAGAETAPAASTPEVQNLSKTELMRRERVRVELRNEDVLQERLEQLRLRDEKHRTDELIAGKPLDETAVTTTAAAPAATPALQNQLVVPLRPTSPASRALRPPRPRRWLPRYP